MRMTHTGSDSIRCFRCEIIPTGGDGVFSGPSRVVSSTELIGATAHTDADIVFIGRPRWRLNAIRGIEATPRTRGEESDRLLRSCAGRRLGLVPEAIALAGTHQQVDLATLHLLLEQTESGLLPQVERLIDAFKRLADLGPEASVKIVQRLELIPQRIVLPWRLGEAPQFLQHPAALHLTAAARLLQRFDARKKFWELLVAQLQRLLR